MSKRCDCDCCWFLFEFWIEFAIDSSIQCLGLWVCLWPDCEHMWRYEGVLLINNLSSGLTEPVAEENQFKKSAFGSLYSFSSEKETKLNSQTNKILYTYIKSHTLGSSPLRIQEKSSCYVCYYCLRHFVIYQRHIKT